MYYRPLRRRPRYTYTIADKARRRRRGPRANALLALLISAVVLVLLFSFVVFLNRISSQIAVSDAKDAVVSSINSAVIEIMNEGTYSTDSFVTYEKSEDGTVTLIRSNMAQINTLSAELLRRIVNESGSSAMTIKIPIGNLTGLSFLMGRGADIPVDVVVLTSSTIEFGNSIVSAGINQTKHQINLKICVDIDVMIPWGMRSAEVVTEVLIADTVISGRVPDTYLNVN